MSHTPLPSDTIAAEQRPEPPPAVSGHSLRFIVLVIILFLLCCISPDSGARQQSSKPRIDVVDLARRLHAQINLERANQGLRKLAWNESLARIAAKHSRDMANREYLSHVSPEGRNFSDRYDRAGFKCAIVSGSDIYSGAENIALSHLYNTRTIVNGVSHYEWNSTLDIVQKTVKGWMNSAGHRKNILMPFWKNEGIGIVIEKEPGSRIYITQNFC